MDNLSRPEQARSSEHGSSTGEAEGSNAVGTERVYGKWGGNPEGIKEDTSRCVAYVREDRWTAGYQCSRKRGWLGGLYCKQHGKMKNETETCQCDFCQKPCCQPAQSEAEAIREHDEQQRKLPTTKRMRPAKATKPRGVRR